MKQKRSSRPELGEPVILRCQPYKIPLTELLLPHKISPVEFFRLWPSLPAVVEYTGTYIYEGSGFKATAAQQYGSSPFLDGLKSLSSKPFHRVCSHIIRTVAGFQVGISLCFEVLELSFFHQNSSLSHCLCYTTHSVTFNYKLASFYPISPA